MRLKPRSRVVRDKAASSFCGLAATGPQPKEPLGRARSAGCAVVIGETEVPLWVGGASTGGAATNSPPGILITYAEVLGYVPGFARGWSELAEVAS